MAYDTQLAGAERPNRWLPLDNPDIHKSFLSCATPLAHWVSPYKTNRIL